MKNILSIIFIFTFSFSAYSYSLNVGSKEAGTGSGQIFSAKQNGIECTYSLSYPSVNVRPSGRTGSVNVITQAGCPWTAVSNVPWIVITSGSSGTGNGTVVFTVLPNTGEARTGTLTIAGQTFTVFQTSGIEACMITLPSATLEFGAAGGSGAFSVEIDSGCPWTATTTASWITIVDGNGVGDGSVSFVVARNTGPARSATISVNGQVFNITQAAGLGASNRTRFDFDGDGKSDFSIYRPPVGEWWYLRSSDGGHRVFQFGTATDKIVPADYTGDGKTDFAFYRNGEWFILRSENFSFYSFPFGLAGDIPVPADYDGDGKDDAAVFRPSTNVWYVLKSTGGATVRLFSTSADAVPVPADYNGDGRADFAVYEPSANIWRIKTDVGELSYLLPVTTGEVPVPADYTGDGKADIAVYYDSNKWLIVRSEDDTSFTTNFGIAGDIPVPADYDGDGKTDIAIYRPSTRHWWYAASSANGQQRAREFGLTTDIPVPSAYIIRRN